MTGENPFRQHAPGFGEDPGARPPELLARARPRLLLEGLPDAEDLRPVAESEGWCASEEGQARLGKEVAGLRVLEEVFGCTTKVHLQGERVHVAVTRDDLGTIEAVMGDGYPDHPASILVPDGPLPPPVNKDRLVAERLAVWLQASEGGTSGTEP